MSKTVIGVLVLGIAIFFTGLTFSIFAEIRRTGFWLGGIGLAIIIGIIVIHFLEKRKRKQP